jgi:hypothetical protein
MIDCRFLRLDPHRVQFKPLGTGSSDGDSGVRRLVAAMPFGQLAAAGETSLRGMPRNGNALASQRTPKTAAQHFELRLIPIAILDLSATFRHDAFH